MNNPPWRIRAGLLGLWIVGLSVLFSLSSSAQPLEDPLRKRLASAEGSERAEVLVELTRRDAQEDPAQALVWGREALLLLAQEENPRAEIRVRNALCLAHLNQAQYSECVSHGEQAASSARAIDYPDGLSEALLHLGRAHTGLTEIDRAFTAYDEAVRHQDEGQDPAALAAALLGRCFVQSRRGQYPKALQDCLRSRDLYEQLDDLEGLTRSLLRMGNISAQLGRLEEALAHYLHLLDLKPSDDSTVGNLLNNIGFLYTQTGDLESAISYLTRTLAHFEQMGRTRGVIRALNNLGTVYKRLGNAEKALSHFRPALEKARAAGLKRGESSALANIAMVYRDRGDFTAAIDLFEQSVHILRGTGETLNLRLVLRELSSAYAQAGRDEQALETFKEYSTLNREAFDRQASETQAELLARFESERQQRELELLHRQREAAGLELKRQKDLQRFMVVGFALSLGVVLLWIHRSRLATEATAMEETVSRERAMNDRLRELDQLKDEFLANTSHELKTPLYGITGLAESLLGGSAGQLNATAKSSLGSLVVKGQELSERIDALLDVSEASLRRGLAEAGKDQSDSESDTSDLRKKLGLTEAQSVDTPPVHPLENTFDGIRVLVVDDEPINLQVISGFLAPEGFEIATATHGEQALGHLETESFDLVLLDVMMPELSGFEVCRSIRQKQGLAELPIIFLTVKGRDSDLVNGMAAGANDYLTKPISKDRLLSRVRPHLQLLHHHRHGEELVAEKISQIKVLSGLLPICGFCKKIRDDQGFWSEVEQYIHSHSEAEFNQGICPECSGLAGTTLEDRPSRASAPSA